LSRVLFLAESFHPGLGGGEAPLRRLGASLVAGGDAATVVTRRAEPSWAADDEVEGIRVRRVPPSGPGRSGKYRMVPAALKALVAEAGRHDVLVVRGTRVLGLPALVAARVAGLPVVLQPEINGELDGEVFTWGKPWANGIGGRAVKAAVAVRNLWLRDADAFVAMSRRIRDEMAGAGIAADRVWLIPHGVDTARFRPASPEEAAALRRRLGLPAAGVLIVFTGRLLRGKGLETLLDAFAVLAGADAGLHLALVGSGDGQSLSIEDELRERARSGVLAGRVTFSGRVDAVEDWLRAADLFAFPSAFEALGISLVGLRPGRRGQPYRRHRGRHRGPALGAAGRAGGRRCSRAGAAGAGRGRAAAARDGPPRPRRRARALRRARRPGALPGAVRRGQRATAAAAGTCSSCRWRFSSITGRSSLNEKYSASRITVAKTPTKWIQR
jgi:glycosyltransferase involved in cell wall biosynthesis